MALDNEVSKALDEVYLSSDEFVDYANGGRKAAILLGLYLCHIDAVKKVEGLIRLQKEMGHETEMAFECTSGEMMNLWFSAGCGKNPKLKYIPSPKL